MFGNKNKETEEMSKNITTLRDNLQKEEERVNSFSKEEDLLKIDILNKNINIKTLKKSKIFVLDEYKSILDEIKNIENKLAEINRVKLKSMIYINKLNMEIFEIKKKLDQLGDK